MIPSSLPENAQAAMSYAVAGVGATVSLADAATSAQHLTIVFALIVVVLRVAHDTVRFVRYLRRDKPDE